VNQVRGLPFRVAELMTAIRSVIDGTEQRTVIGTAGRYGTTVTTNPNGVPSIKVGAEGADTPAQDAAHDAAAQPFDTDHEVELLAAEAPPGDPGASVTSTTATSSANGAHR
jgi:hypothetical protein